MRSLLLKNITDYEKTWDPNTFLDSCASLLEGAESCSQLWHLTSAMLTEAHARAVYAGVINAVISSVVLGPCRFNGLEKNDMMVEVTLRHCHCISPSWVPRPGREPSTYPLIHLPFFKRRCLFVSSANKILSSGIHPGTPPFKVLKDSYLVSLSEQAEFTYPDVIDAWREARDKIHDGDANTTRSFVGKKKMSLELRGKTLTWNNFGSVYLLDSGISKSDRFVSKTPSESEHRFHRKLILGDKLCGL